MLQAEASFFVTNTETLQYEGQSVLLCVDRLKRDDVRTCSLIWCGQSSSSVYAFRRQVRSVPV